MILEWHLDSNNQTLEHDKLGITPAAEMAQSSLSPWQKAVIVMLALWAGIAVAFWPDISDIVDIWWTISAYNHLLLVPIILAWYISQCRAELARLTPHIWGWALVPMAIGALLWILGQASSIALFRHIAVVLMLQSAVILSLGQSVSRMLLFPLAFSFFMVPIGSEMVPILQHYTASASSVLLTTTGLENSLNGLFITTQAGIFIVAEECSGIEFLLAMLVFAILLAKVFCTSTKRRFAFLVLAIAIPIIGNWVRVWGIIWLAEFTSLEYATGVDHVLYGWIFFALLLALTLAIGWRLFDKSIDAPVVDQILLDQCTAMDKNYRKKQDEKSPNKGQNIRMITAFVALLAVPLLWNMNSDIAPAPIVENPQLPYVNGWVMENGTTHIDWQPLSDGARYVAKARYHKKGKTVDVFIATYDKQDEEHDILGWGQGAYNPYFAWSLVEDGAHVFGQYEGAKTSRMAWPGGALRSAITYRQMGQYNGSDEIWMRLDAVKSRLLLQPQGAAIMMFSAQSGNYRDNEEVLADFMKDLGDARQLMNHMLWSNGG